MKSCIQSPLGHVPACLSRRLFRVVAAAGMFATAAVVVGCNGDFDPASRVTDLRILAVRADAPYAAPGQSVHLEALVVEPQGRALTSAWGLCVNPASPSAPGCLAALDASTLVIEHDRRAFDWTIPDDVITKLPVEVQSRAAVGAVVVACPGELHVATGEIPFQCTDGAGRVLGTDEYAVGVKRIFARTSDTNANPVIAGITFDGVDWPAEEIKDVTSCDESTNDYKQCENAETHAIAVSIPAESAESGVDSFGTSFNEQVVAQYYASEGIFEHEVRFATDTKTGWVARREAAGREVTMWFVVRDDRGGVTWEERRVRVAPR
jgi:hypothetical protein